MKKEKSETRELLVLLLKKDDKDVDAEKLSFLSPESWQDLLALSKMQRVTPLLWHRLKKKGLDKVVPDAAVATLREASRRNTLRNLRLNGELRLLLTALSAENIPLIMLKGIALSNTVYETIGLREMNDIDVLARTEHLMRIADILMDMGYKSYKSHTVQSEHHLPCLIKKGHAGFEIHWNLIEPGEHYNMDTHGFWERSAPIQISGCRTLTLSPEDMLLHICLHTSYQHAFTFGLRPFCDIAEIIDYFTPDWQIILDRACDQGWQRGLYLGLRLAVELAGAAVPGYILEKLRTDDMSGAILETARAQIFTDNILAASIPASMAQLMKNRSLSGKIKIFRQRVFLSKVLIADIYSVPINSIMIYSCYLRRFYDLVRRHWRTFKKIRGNDPALKSIVERKHLIANWLAQPAAASRRSGRQDNR
jgi:hypothetical protein